MREEVERDKRLLRDLGKTVGNEVVPHGGVERQRLQCGVEVEKDLREGEEAGGRGVAVEHPVGRVKVLRIHASVGWAEKRAERRRKVILCFTERVRKLDVGVLLHGRPVRLRRHTVSRSPTVWARPGDIFARTTTSIRG